jgi:hypothetical protein
VSARGKKEPIAKEKDKEKDKKKKITIMTEIQVRQADYRLKVTCAYYVVNKEFLS